MYHSAQVVPSYIRFATHILEHVHSAPSSLSRRTLSHRSIQRASPELLRLLLNVAHCKMRRRWLLMGLNVRSLARMLYDEMWSWILGDEPCVWLRGFREEEYVGGSGVRLSDGFRMVE